MSGYVNLELDGKLYRITYRPNDSRVEVRLDRGHQHWARLPSWRDLKQGGKRHQDVLTAAFKKGLLPLEKSKGEPL